jgi:hypothetical protein
MCGSVVYRLITGKILRYFLQIFQVKTFKLSHFCLLLQPTTHGIRPSKAESSVNPRSMSLMLYDINGDTGTWPS